jgi:hypothetical protein
MCVGGGLWCSWSVIISVLFQMRSPKLGESSALTYSSDTSLLGKYSCPTPTGYKAEGASGLFETW